MENLTIKELRFITEYLLDFNATKAAVRAGYSEKWANKIGPELLKKPQIEMEIKKIKDSILLNHKVTIDRVIHELFKIAFGDENSPKLRMSDLFHLERLKSSDYILKEVKNLSISKNSIHISFIDRLKAAELLVNIFINCKSKPKPISLPVGLLDKLRQRI